MLVLGLVAGLLSTLVVGGAGVSAAPGSGAQKGFNAIAYAATPTCEPGTLVPPATCDLPSPTASARTGRIVAADPADPMVITSGLDGNAPTDGAATSWAALTFADQIPEGVGSATYRFAFDVDSDAVVSMSRPGSFATLLAFGCVRLRSTSACLTTASMEIATTQLGSVGPSHLTGWSLDLTLTPPAGQTTVTSGKYLVSFSLESAVNTAEIATVWSGVGTSQGGVTLRSYTPTHLTS
jgi:hypothetical protein